MAPFLSLHSCPPIWNASVSQRDVNGSLHARILAKLQNCHAAVADEFRHLTTLCRSLFRVVISSGHIKPRNPKLCPALLPKVTLTARRASFAAAWSFGLPF